MSKVNDILSKREQATKFDKVLDDRDIKKLLSIRNRCVVEHFRVFKLVCVGLDVGFGYLLPTLTSMVLKLDMLLERSPRINGSP